MTSPRKAQPPSTEAKGRQDELISLLSRRSLLSQEAYIPDAGTWAAHPAMELLPSGQQVIVRTHSAFGDRSVAETQEAMQAAMQHAGPVPADVRALPRQHASAAGLGRYRQALGINPYQTAERLDGVDSQVRSARGLGALNGPAGTVSRAQATLLPVCKIDLAQIGSDRQQAHLHASIQLPQADCRQGTQALCRGLSEQQPVRISYSRPAPQETQRAAQSPIAEAEDAVRCFRSRIWQQGMLPEASAADTSRPPVKQGTPPGARAATLTGLARLAHAACLPSAEQRSEASNGLDPDQGGQPLSAAQRHLPVVPPRSAGMPLLMSRPRSACSPIAAAMQCPPNSTPPPAWGNTF